MSELILGVHRVAMQEGGTENWGEFQSAPPQMAIRINAEVEPGPVRASLVLHEALHAVINVYGIRVEGGEDGEEALVRGLEGALMALVRDNPGHARLWLREACGEI